MIVDLKGLIGGEVSELRFDFQVDPEDQISFEEDEEKVFSLAGKVIFRRTDFGVVGDFDVEGEVEMVCDRCLQRFTQKIKTQFSQEFIFFNAKISDGDYYYQDLKNEGFVIDEYNRVKLNETLREGILVALPMKKICKENCQGIIKNS